MFSCLGQGPRLLVSGGRLPASVTQRILCSRYTICMKRRQVGLKMGKHKENPSFTRKRVDRRKGIPHAVIGLGGPLASKFSAELISAENRRFPPSIHQKPIIHGKRKGNALKCDFDLDLTIWEHMRAYLLFAEIQHVPDLPPSLLLVNCRKRHERLCNSSGPLLLHVFAK